MATPNSRIASGLNSREDHPKLSLRDFTSLLGEDGKLPDPGVLKETAASSQRRLEKLRAARDQVAEHVANAKHKAEQQAHELRDTLDHGQRGEMIRKAVQKARADALAVTAEDRERHLSEIRSAAHKVDALREVYASPSLYLSMQTITSRKPYMDALAHAGPAELRGAALNATATGNAKMMAAVLAVADGRGIKISDIAGCSRDEAALAVVPEFSDLRSQIETLAHAAEDALTVEREAQSGQRDANAQIARGLRNQGKGEPEADPEPAEGAET